MALGELEPAALVERDYAIQRGAYALAGLQQDGVERVEVAYCLLERPQEPVAAVFTRADIPALPGRRARAGGRAAGRALARRRRAAPRPVRRLPGAPRALLVAEALTLRPAYEASAGSLAGSGGPS